MTRFARRGTQSTKKPLEASSWTELKKGWEECSQCHQKRHSPGGCPRSSPDPPKRGEPSSTSADVSSSKAKSKLEVKRQRRREEKRLKRIRMREKSRVCEFCHDIGHQTSECPCRITDTSCFGACVQCGSTDHATAECRGPSNDGVCARCHEDGHREADCPGSGSSDEESDVPPEPCPICHELGHEVKGCPDNPRSIYPMGGCCKECGSVEHKTKLCPDVQPVKVEEIKLSTRSFGSRESADAYGSEELNNRKETKMVKPQKRKQKIVVF